MLFSACYRVYLFVHDGNKDRVTSSHMMNIAAKVYVSRLTSTCLCYSFPWDQPVALEWNVAICWDTIANLDANPRVAGGGCRGQHGAILAAKQGWLRPHSQKD